MTEIFSLFQVEVEVEGATERIAWEGERIGLVQEEFANHQIPRIRSRIALFI